MARVETGYNPAAEFLEVNDKRTGILDGDVRALIAKMNALTDNLDAVNAFLTECKVRKLDEKDNAIIDFEGSKIQEIIDKLYDAGILEENDYGEKRVYKLTTCKELEILKIKLEGKRDELKNKSPEYLPLIQAFLNLIEQLNKIAKACCDSDIHFKERVNGNIKG